VRRLLAILLLLSLCIQCFLQLGIVGWYELNTKSITQKYCVNKSKPQLHCNGKCHLRKQLDKAGSKQSKDQENKQTEWVAFILPDVFAPATATALTSIIKHFAPQNFYSFLHLYSVFHPPQVV